MASCFELRHAAVLVSISAVILTFSCVPSDRPQTGGSRPVDAAPEIGALSPLSGAGRTPVFRVVASHPEGATAIHDLQVLIDARMTPTGSGACWIDVNSLSSVAVRTEDATAWLPYVRIGSAGTSANSKCSVAASEVKVETKGPELTVTLPVTLAPAFKGVKKVWVIASGPRQHSGWQERGIWTAN